MPWFSNFKFILCTISVLSLEMRKNRRQWNNLPINYQSVIIQLTRWVLHCNLSHIIWFLLVLLTHLQRPMIRLLKVWVFGLVTGEFESWMRLYITSHMLRFLNGKVGMITISLPHNELKWNGIFIYIDINTYINICTCAYIEIYMHVALNSLQDMPYSEMLWLSMSTGLMTSRAWLGEWGCERIGRTMVDHDLWG